MSDVDAAESAGEPDGSDIGFDQEGLWDADLVSLRNLLIVLSLGLWGLAIWYAYDQTIAKAQYGMLFLGGILVLYIMMELMSLTESNGRSGLVADLKEAYGPGNRLEAGILTFCAIDVVLTCGYLVLRYQQVTIERQGRALAHEYVGGVVFIFVMGYLTWRSFGRTFLAVFVIGFLYAYFGPYAPGLLSHGGLSAERIIRIAAINDDGFFGFLTQLVAAWIALFMLYAGLLKSYGAFDIIMRVSFRGAKYIDSGIAQTAVLSSAIIGSVNGSQTANAGMTGSLTIPLMKRNGVKPETAGAIEAVASTAGQVLPPVMGAGAFIMASLITGITYVDVIIAGLIPAAILSLTIFVAVHYVAAPQLEDANLNRLIQDPMPREKFLTEIFRFGLPLAILMYKLGVEGVTVMTAALWTAVAMLITGPLVPLVRSLVGLTDESAVGSLKRTGWETLDGAREGVAVVAPVTVILAAINGFVDLLTATGVPGQISLTLFDLTGGVLLYAAIISMVICMVLGLGMPTTASYTIVALLIAPTLISQFFLPDLASHFFVFYAAILAGLTPPIATCVAVACGIAGGNFWGSCVEAIKISAPLFVLPFVFVYHPEIVSAELNQLTLTSAGFALIGAVAIIHGINYRFTYGRLANSGLRVAFFTAGVLAMVYPGRLVQAGAMVAAVLMYVFQSITGRPNPIEAVTGFFNLGTESVATADAEQK